MIPYLYYTKIGILPPNIDPINFDCHIDKSFKKKYGITKIEIVDDLNSLENNDINKPRSFATLFEGILYLTNKPISQIPDHLKKLLIIIFPGNHKIENVSINAENVYFIGLEKKNTSIIDIHSILKLKCENVHFKNLAFKIIGKKNNFHYSEELTTSGIFIKSDNSFVSNCIFDNSSECYQICKFAKNKMVSFKRSIFKNGQLYLDLTQQSSISSSRFYDSNISTHTSSCNMYLNYFQETDLWLFQNKNTIITYNQFYPSEKMYYQIQCDYQTECTVSTNQFFNVCVNNNIDKKDYKLKLFSFDRHSKMWLINNHFDIFKSLGKIEWESGLILISNIFCQNEIELSFRDGKIKSNNNNLCGDQEIIINYTDEDIRIPDKIVHMM